MEEKLNIYQKLMHIQNKLKAPKNQYNSFGKYKYRNCEDILEALKPLLLEYNCILVINDNIEERGNRFYITAEVKIICCDTEKEISSKASAREEETKKGMDGSQITGTASSYARKYALNGLFLTDDTKDSDSTNTGNLEKKEEPKKEEQKKEFGNKIFPISEKQLFLLKKEVGKRGAEGMERLKELLHKCFCKKAEEIQIKDFNGILEEIKKIKETV